MSSSTAQPSLVVEVCRAHLDRECILCGDVDALWMAPRALDRQVAEQQAQLAQLKKANERLSNLINLIQRQLKDVAEQRDEWQQACQHWRRECFASRAKSHVEA